MARQSSTLFEHYQQAVEAHRPAFPYAALLGMELVEVEPGRAVVTLEVNHQLQNPVGTVHGGVYCSLADTAMGIAYSAGLNPGKSFVTVDLQISFLRPARGGRLIAEGRVLKAGRRIGFLECDIRDDTGSLLARASSTYLTLPAQDEDRVKP